MTALRTSGATRPSFGLVGLILLACLAAAAPGQSVWTGAVSTDWDDPANWMTGPPSGTSSADIPAGTPFSPVTTGSAKACRDLIVQAGATVTLGAGAPLFINRNATINGTITGVEPVMATGSLGRTWTTGAGGSFGDVEINTTSSVSINGVMTGDLTLTGGTLLPTFGGTVTVNGNALLQGGTLVNGGAGTLDVDGNLTFSGTSCNSAPTIRCGGDFTADAAFAPGGGTVHLDGSSPQVLSGSAFRGLVIAAGATVTTSDDLVIGGTLTVDGSFATSGILDLNLHTVLNGSMDFGTEDHTFAGSLTANGAVVFGTKLTFDGAGSGTITSVVPLPDVEISGSSTKSFATGTIAGNLVLLSGTLITGFGATLTVTGNALLQGGTLANGGAGTLDVDGNLTFSGTSCNNAPTIRCGGDFTADAAFAPGGGTVHLDGSSPQVLSGSAFRGLVIAAGATVTTSDDLVIGGTLTVDGSFATSGILDLNLHTVLNGSMDFGTEDHTFAGSLTANGAVVFGTKLTFDGAGSGTITSVVPLPDVEISGSSTKSFATGTIAGNLVLLSGTLITGFGATLTVTGNALLQGGTLANGGAGTLDVDGNLTFSGTSCNSAPTIRCGGDFTADAAFAPGGGTVHLDGSSPQVLSGSAFRGLVIAAGATVTTSDDLVIGGTLTVDGSFATSGILDLNLHTVLNGSMDFGTEDHTFAGSLTANGAVVFGTKLTFDGAGSGTITSVVPLPDVEISGSSTKSFATGTIAGNLVLLSGTLTTGFGATLTVTGNALLQGGTLANGGAGTLDVDGNLTFSGTSCNSAPTIRCGGDFTADAAFAPGGGTVHLDGSSPQVLSGSAFRGLVIAAGATVTTSDDLVIGGTLTVDGSFATSGILDLNLHTVLNGSMDFGTEDHTFAGSLTANGAVVFGTKLTFDGAGSGTITSVVPLPDVEISGSSTKSFATGTIAGNLVLLSGTLTTGFGATLTVTGNALLQGGTLANGGAGTLDVDGNVTFSGTSCTNPPTIRCGGDFTADTAFAPTNGTVILDGATPSTFAAGGTPGDTLNFSNLTIENAVRTPVQDVTLAATSITIANGGTLDIGARKVTIPSATVTVNGMLTAGANGRLCLGSSLVDVMALGTLDLAGSAANPARVEGTTGAGYGLTVSGTIRARNYSFEGMNGSGVVITNQATIAAAPMDLRQGRFDNPAIAGGPLLDIRRASVTTIEQVTFENTNGFAAFNVQATAGSRINFKNWSGAFAGPSFENDPMNLVFWSDTELASSEFTGLAEQVRIRWTTTLEPPNVTSFMVAQATSPAGPFVPFTTVPVAGPGSSYEVFDTGLTADQDYYYQLLEVTASGSNPFGSGQATPYSADLPPNVLLVGPNGAHADVQSALMAASDPQTIIMVEPGTYPSFTVDPSVVPTSLRFISDGNGPVMIDTSTGPVVLQNLPASTDVFLSELVLGDPSSPNPGLVLSQCDATILLDGVTVHGGAGQPGVDIASCPHVGIQGCTIDGAPGLRADTGSEVVMSRGSLDALELNGSSNARLCELVPGTTTIDATSQMQSLTGFMPRILMPRTASLGFDLTVTVDTNPLQLYVLLYAFDFRWFDSSNPVIEMIGYVTGLNQAVIALMGFTDATGQAGFTLELPADPALLGLEVDIQHITYDFAQGAYRWSEAAGVLLLP